MARFLLRTLVRVVIVAVIAGVALAWRERQLAGNERTYGDTHRRRG